VVIYGVALLAACMLAGMVLGDLLGALLGVEANVGGVGIAMLLLIFAAHRTNIRAELAPVTSSGISFWSAMYIPIVVAMAAKQNVIAAVSSGWLAIVAGVAAVVASFLMVPVLARLGRSRSDD
jgi:malonate transporter MadL subunit